MVIWLVKDTKHGSELSFLILALPHIIFHIILETDFKMCMLTTTAFKPTAQRKPNQVL
jgi:hypothetical protein